jgi:hypothetical protein
MGAPATLAENVPDVPADRPGSIEIATTMAKKTEPTNPLQARWRITWMDQWDQGFVDEDVEGYFEFGPNNSGSFQFGYVRGNIDYRASIRDAKPCVEFSWDGNDESTAAQGRGWAVLDGKMIKGMIYFHEGDESEFKASRGKAKRR